MTAPESVTQADIAASSPIAIKVMIGELTHEDLHQAFARHRQSAEAASYKGPVDIDALADELTSAANIVTNDGYYEIDTDAVARRLGKAFASAEAASREREARLESALGALCFIDMGKDEDEGVAYTTQEVWEIIHRDRVQDWFSFEDLDEARAALAHRSQEGEG